MHHHINVLKKTKKNKHNLTKGSIAETKTIQSANICRKGKKTPLPQSHDSMLRDAGG